MSNIDKRRKKVLSELFKKYNGICQRCKCKTFLPTSGNGGKQTAKQATIQHIISKLKIIRFLHGEFDYCTLYCFNCNMIENKEENKQIVDEYRKTINYFVPQKDMLIKILKEEYDFNL